MSSRNSIIVGLGNKGGEYEGTRHNIGFMVLDELADRWRIDIDRLKWDSLSGTGRLFGQSLFLLKPMTYMNLSGKGVVEYARFFKIDPDRILVIQDDLDMAAGRIKLVRGGGAGGHKGILSVVQHLGTKDFFRLKIGIGRPGQGGVHRDFPVEKYVLSRLTDDEVNLLSDRYDQLEQGLRVFFEEGAPRAMSLL
ncbi:aminoacyl-tRNA hydrolase, partial [Desulfomarina sp.]